MKHSFSIKGSVSTKIKILTWKIRKSTSGHQNSPCSKKTVNKNMFSRIDITLLMPPTLYFKCLSLGALIYGF